jgi:hypothetical protein
MLGNSNLEELHGVGFPGFSSCFTYPRLDTEEASNLKTLMEKQMKQKQK